MKISSTFTSPQVDSFVAIGIGNVYERADKNIFKRYSIQVAGDAVAATAWSVDLEGSLNGVNFDTILTHTTGTGDGKVMYSGAEVYPAKYIRSNLASLTLGSATKLKVYILGSQ